MFTFIIGLVVGFVGGALLTLQNPNKVNKLVTMFKQKVLKKDLPRED